MTFKRNLFYSTPLPHYVLDAIADRSLETHKHHLTGMLQLLLLSIVGILTLNLKWLFSLQQSLITMILFPGFAIVVSQNRMDIAVSS